MLLTRMSSVPCEDRYPLSRSDVAVEPCVDEKHVHKRRGIFRCHLIHVLLHIEINMSDRLCILTCVTIKKTLILGRLMKRG